MAGTMQQANTSPVAVTRLGRNLAAEISGIDLSGPLGEAAFDTVHHALLEHEVLIFRDQDITAR